MMLETISESSDLLSEVAKSGVIGRGQPVVSCRGSWLSLTKKGLDGRGGANEDPISLCVLSGAMWESPKVFEIRCLLDGRELDYKEEYGLGFVFLRGHRHERYGTVAFQNHESLRIRADGVHIELRLREDATCVRLSPSSWTIRANSWCWLSIQIISGVVSSQEGVPAVVALDGTSGPAEVMVTRSIHGGFTELPLLGIEEASKAWHEDYLRWRPPFPGKIPQYYELWERETKNIWNLIVFSEGNYRRDCILVSKGFLVGLWSWDHCWHMLVCARLDPVLSWNNLLAIFDHQHVSGALPDVVAANQMMWGYLKPPVHGWMLHLLEQRCDWITDDHRTEIYPKICLWTEFWLTQRCEGPLPHYRHGNDSGWDNSSVFDLGVPVESPDLATWLILQQDWLAHTAQRLGYLDDAIKWRIGSETMLRDMLNRFWDGNMFVGRLTDGGGIVRSKSLLLKIPLLLGNRLPEEIKRWCLMGLNEPSEFLGSAGLYSESLSSGAFEGDGYWRGAIWPVTNFIFIEALLANGRFNEARELAHSFLRHIASEGNFENYRGDTGRGARDGSIAWTSSCALLLIDDLNSGRFDV